MMWFKHDTDASSDAKIKKLILRYGVTGYGIYFHCLELIVADVNESNITFSLEHDAEIIADNLKIKGTAERSGIDIVNEIMHYIVELGLFEDNDGRITCYKIMKRLDSSMTSNSKLRNALSKSHDAVMIPSCQKRREEKRIRKEEKREPPPRAEFVPPTLSEIQIYCAENKYRIDAQHFLDYYSANDWKDSRDKPIKNWKLKLVSWANRDKAASPEPEAPRTCPVCGKIQHSDICKNQDCPTVRAIMDADTDALWGQK